MQLPIACPAASPVQPADDQPSVVCGVLEIANEGAEVGGFTERGHVSALFSGSRDAGTVQNFCAGRGIPGSPMSYCSCVIWQAEKDRIAAQRKAGPDGLRDPGRRERPAPVGA